MIYLLHGENLGASRQALLDLKKNYSSDSISAFDAKKIDVDEFVRVCETPSMLSDRRLVILEGKIQLSTINYPLSTIPSTTDLLFWVGEGLKPSNKLLKQVKELGGQIRVFKDVVPKHVFGFLDALGYKNEKRAFLELHRLLDQGEAPLYLLKMMVWEARNLLNVKCLPASGGSKLKMNPFVRRKTQSQVENFEEEELVEIFRKLLEAEVSLKTTQLDPVLVLDRLVGGITNV